MHGWYSKKAVENGCGTSWYKSIDSPGHMIEITCITEDPEGASYLWDDKKYVGEVGDFIRIGKKTSSNLYRDFIRRDY